MQPNAWKTLKSFLQGRPLRPAPAQPPPLADKMQTMDFFRESISQLDDAALESMINTPSMQIMNWTMNPIEMIRMSEASIRNSAIKSKKKNNGAEEEDDEDEDEEDESDVYDSESQTTASRTHEKDIERRSSDDTNS
jgi:hypothetical protein